MKTRDRILERLNSAGWQKVGAPFWETPPTQDQAAREEIFTVARLIDEEFFASGRKQLPDNRLDQPRVYTATTQDAGCCWLVSGL